MTSLYTLSLNSITAISISAALKKLIKIIFPYSFSNNIHKNIKKKHEIYLNFVYNGLVWRRRLDFFTFHI